MKIVGLNINQIKYPYFKNQTVSKTVSTMQGADDKTITTYEQLAPNKIDFWERAEGHTIKYFDFAFGKPSTNNVSKKIVDIGSGSGRDILVLKQKGYDAYGIEPSKEIQDLVSKKHPELSDKLINDFLPDLQKCPDNFFDGALCTTVLMHLPAKSFEGSIKNIKRIVKNKGRVIISVPVNKENHSLPLKSVGNQNRDKDGRLFTPIDEKMLQGAFGSVPLKVFIDADGAGRADRELLTMIFEVEHNLNRLIEYLNGKASKRNELIEGDKNSILAKIIPEFAAVYDKKHPPHQEGNLGEHMILFYKNMVEMLNTKEFGEFNKNDQVLLLLSSVLHDVGKDCPEIFLKEIQTPAGYQLALSKLTNAGHKENKAKKLLEEQCDKGIEALVYKHPLHNIASRDRARNILEKMGMEQKQIEEVCNLIEKHMIIGEFSYKTLKEDNLEYYNQRIKEVAAEIKDERELRLLYIHTCADQKALKKDGSSFGNSEKENLEMACEDIMIAMQDNETSQPSELSYLETIFKFFTKTLGVQSAPINL
jgi:SAM-dependent methyltransferase